MIYFLQAKEQFSFPVSLSVTDFPSWRPVYITHIEKREVAKEKRTINGRLLYIGFKNEKIYFNILCQSPIGLDGLDGK